MSWRRRSSPASTALLRLNASRPVAAQHFQAEGLIHTSPGQHPGFIDQLLSGCRPSACFIAKDESRLQRSCGFALVNPGRCPTAVELRKFPREARRLPPLLPPREERVGVRRAVLIQLNSPHPSPLPVRRGEGEATLRSMSFLNSTAVHPRSHEAERSRSPGCPG